MEKEIGWLLQEKYHGKMTAGAKRDIKRLESGEPLDHIIGFTDFLNCKILVDGNVLIPRPETELMAERGIEELGVLKLSSYKVLDMFAGSGCIGIAVLKKVKNAQVTFVDSQQEAVAQIKKNCRLNKISAQRYQIIRSDIFEKVKGDFDYIFANPPYIPNNQETINKMQKSVIDYEPHTALFGGKDGMEFIRRFLAEAKNRLNPEGKIFMEFDSPQKTKINALLKKLNYKTWDFCKDQYGKWRWVVIQ